jgi:hypothetical protein
MAEAASIKYFQGELLTPAKQWPPDLLCCISLFHLFSPEPHPAGLKSSDPNSTWCSTSKDIHVHIHHCENLKSDLIYGIIVIFSFS